VILDLRSRRIPNRLVLSLAAGGIATALWKACVAATWGPAGLPGQIVRPVMSAGARQAPLPFSAMLSPTLRPLLACMSGGLVALVLLTLLTLIFPGAIGGGDVKLLAASGLYLGFAGALRAIVFTFLSGGILTLLMVALGRAKLRGKIPYAPAIAVGVLAALSSPATGLW